MSGSLGSLRATHKPMRTQGEKLRRCRGTFFNDFLQLLVKQALRVARRKKCEAEKNIALRLGPVVAHRICDALCYFCTDASLVLKCCSKPLYTELSFEILE